MPCSICRSYSHDARRCSDSRIITTYHSIRTMLCSERNSSSSLNFMRQINVSREKMPFWNNVWARLRIRNFTENNAYHSRETILNFLYPKPKSITELKQRFRNWINNISNNNRVEQSPWLSYSYSHIFPFPIQNSITQPYGLSQVVPTNKIRLIMDDNETTYYHDNDCAICMEPMNFKNKVAYNCKHTFCATCVKKHIVKHTGQCCPICRVNVNNIRFKSELSSKNFNLLSEHVSNLS